MNAIQKFAVVGWLVVMCIGMVLTGRPASIVVYLLAYTIMFLGYVCGALWKVRHALHLWWSTFAAFLLHLALLPFFIKLLRWQSAAGHSAWKLYMYALVGLTCGEVIFSVFVSKRVAVWTRHRSGHFVPEHHDSGPGSLLA